MEANFYDASKSSSDRLKVMVVYRAGTNRPSQMKLHAIIRLRQGQAVQLQDFSYQIRLARLRRRADSRVSGGTAGGKLRAAHDLRPSGADDEVRTSAGLMSRLRRRGYELFEHESPTDPYAKFIHRALVALILTNVVASVLDTVPSINAVYAADFDRLEAFSLVIFSLEYAARLWAAPENPIHAHRSRWLARLFWMGSAPGVIDLLAIAPFVLGQLFNIDLHVITLPRLFRFYKIARYSPGFNSLVMALRSERSALTASLVILITMVLTFAGLMYVFEHAAQPDKFGSIPDAMWWAFATVTTVGYGDVIPITLAGRIVGVVTMITGLVMLALPAGIIASAFATNIARQHFIVTAGMLARMPLFDGLEISSILEVLPTVVTRTFERGTQIVHWGAQAGTLYLIVDGEIEVEQARRRRQIGPGEAFGGVIGPQRDLSARALSRVRLMLIETRDVTELCRKLPDFAERIVALAPDERRRQQAEEMVRRRFRPAVVRKSPRLVGK